MTGIESSTYYILRYDHDLRNTDKEKVVYLPKVSNTGSGQEDDNFLRGLFNKHYSFVHIFLFLFRVSL